MPNRSLRTRAVALVAAIALLAGACGDDTADPAPGNPTTGDDGTAADAGSGSDSADSDSADSDSAGSDSAGSDGSSAVGTAPGAVESRHLPDGYAGPAWPVPTVAQPGEHVNDVVAKPLGGGDDGAEETVWLPAGTPVDVVDVAGGLATVALDDGTVVTTSRHDLWRIGDFVSFRDITVEVDGEIRSIGESGLAYHRVDVNNFDDRATEEFEGIANNIRRYLRCDADEWKIANQYFAVDIVADGIDRDDPELVAKGVAAQNWGITQELADDAVFSLYRECDAATARDFSETHHSTQWFAALGRGVFQLAASPFAGEYRAEIAAYVEHLETLATLLTTDAVRQHWRDRWLYEANGDVFTHKFYMRATGLAMASALTDDAEAAARWSSEARAISEEGMSKQWEDGVNPERGGFDVRYQMYGTWLAIVYRSTLADGEHRDELGRMIDAAIAWIQPKLADTGAIDFAGSTRSCTPNSNPNEYHPYHMISAFLLWAHTEPGNDHLYDRAVVADRGQDAELNLCS